LYTFVYYPIYNANTKWDFRKLCLQAKQASHGLNLPEGHANKTHNSAHHVSKTLHNFGPGRARTKTKLGNIMILTSLSITSLENP
jgi:hypothetical protein